MSSFLAFAGDGAYAIGQQAQQAVNVYGQAIYGSTNASLATYANIGNYLSGATITANVPIAYPQPQTSTESNLTEFMSKISKPAKKAAKDILSKLRAEIDGWHGDILERQLA